MAQITITEALQEIKTLGKRLEKKRGGLLPFIARDGRLKDPLGDGESTKFVASERQSIVDLEKRIVQIRTEIQATNLETELKIGDVALSVAEWLNWRREIADQQAGFLNMLVNTIATVKAQLQGGGRQIARGQVIAVNEAAQPPVDVTVKLDEKALRAEIEALEGVKGNLDGKLSLLNATTLIEI
jgi:hypothetical protein